MSHGSAARLGGFSKERQSPAREMNTNKLTVVHADSEHGTETSERTDYFKVANGVAFAGTHLLIELWDAGNLSDVAATEATLVRAAEASGATVLHSYMHPFGPELGVSGVVVLAESHISIHTWPERGYAAVDVFMCGACDPYCAVDVLRDAFAPGNLEIAEHRRGVIG